MKPLERNIWKPYCSFQPMETPVFHLPPRVGNAALDRAINLIGRKRLNFLNGLRIVCARLENQLANKVLSPNAQHLPYKLD
jgi:hypothetical protein